MRIRLFGTLAALACLGVSGCVTAAPTEMTDRQICRDHYSNDPVLRAKCDVNAANRDNAPPDVRPEDLPVQANSPGGLTR